MLDSNVRVKKTCRGHVFSGRGLMNFSNRTEPIRRAGRHRRMNVSILLHCKPKRECRTGIDEPFQSHWTCQVMQKLTHSRAIVFFFKTEILTQHGRIYSFIFLFTKLLNDEPQTHNPKVAPQILLPQPVWVFITDSSYEHSFSIQIHPVCMRWAGFAPAHLFLLCWLCRNVLYLYTQASVCLIIFIFG